MNLPFERNNYFYGKLLTAADFQAEQMYHDQKRQLISRLAMGKGVFLGLEVFKLDDKTIMVQTGAGLDAKGRLVVVHRPVTQKLSLINGFKYDLQSCYLCIELSETCRDEMCSLENIKQYNRIIEDTHLFLTVKAPEKEPKAQNLDELLDDDGYIYLAEINFVTGEDTYYINDVKDKRQIIESQKEPEPVHPVKKTHDGLEAAVTELLKDNKRLAGMLPSVSSGVERIDFGLKAKRDRCFFTNEIVHGLGSGFVSITLGTVHDSSSNAVMHERAIVFDEQNIFDEFLHLAARVNTATGTFSIGVRLTDDTPQNHVLVHWTAVKDNRGKFREAYMERYISIQPAVLSVKCGESHTFEIKGVGFDPSDVVWNLLQPDGGVIDRDGCYHAPDDSGIYEVQAQSGEHMATAFVIVR